MKTYLSNDDYADKEGENLFPDVEDPYITSKTYKCDKCKKTKTLKSTNLFPPFCHGHPMKFTHVVENKFDFASIAKRLIAKSKSNAATPKRVSKKIAKKTKTKPKKKTTKKTKAKKR